MTTRSRAETLPESGGVTPRAAATPEPTTGREEGSGRTLARALLAAGAAALLAAAAPEPAAAQFSSPEAGTGVRFHHIGFDDPSAASIDNVSLLTVPVAGRVEVGERVTVQLSGHWARGRLERPDGTASTVSGFTDATLSASLEVGDGAATITAVGRLPTGRTGYETGELDVVGVVAADLFPFRISSWGTGGGLGLRASTARELGPVDATLSLGYFRSGQFDLLEERLVDYRPGDRLSARAGLTAPVGEAGQIGLQGGFRWFGDDERRDQAIFESGNRYDVLGTYSFPVGEDAGFLYGGYQRRSEGRRLELQEATAAQDLLLAGAGLRMRTGGILLRPEVDARVVQREDDRSEGWGIRVGGRAEVPMGGTTVLPLLRGHLGNAGIRPGEESDFLGVEVGASVRLGGGSR